MTQKSRWGEPTRYSLTELEAFDAMRVFLEALWERGEKSELDIAVVLSWLNCEVWEDRGPLDPAQWEDWLDAIEQVKNSN